MANGTATEEALFGDIDPAIIADVAGIGLGFATGMPTTGYFGTPTTGLSGATAGFHGGEVTGAFRPGSPANIFGQRGVFTAPYAEDAARYAKGGPWGGTRAGSVTNVVVPKAARSLQFLEPQAVTSAQTATKGAQLAEALEAGKYPKSASANALRAAFAEGGNPALSRAAALRALPMTAARFAGPAGAALGVGDLAYRGTSALLEATGGEEWLENLGGNIYEYFNQPESFVMPESGLDEQGRTIFTTSTAPGYGVPEGYTTIGANPEEQLAYAVQDALSGEAQSNVPFPLSLIPTAEAQAMPTATAQSLAGMTWDSPELPQALYDVGRESGDPILMNQLKSDLGRDIAGDPDKFKYYVNYIDAQGAGDTRSAAEYSDHVRSALEGGSGIDSQHVDALVNMMGGAGELPPMAGVIPTTWAKPYIQGASSLINKLTGGLAGDAPAEAYRDVTNFNLGVPFRGEAVDPFNMLYESVGRNREQFEQQYGSPYTEDRFRGAGRDIALFSDPVLNKFDARASISGRTSKLAPVVDINYMDYPGWEAMYGDALAPQAGVDTRMPELDDSRMLASVGDDPASAFRFDAATPVSQAPEEWQPPINPVQAPVYPMGDPRWKPTLGGGTLSPYNIYGDVDVLDTTSQLSELARGIGTDDPNVMSQSAQSLRASFEETPAIANIVNKQISQAFRGSDAANFWRAINPISSAQAAIDRDAEFEREQREPTWFPPTTSSGSVMVTEPTPEPIIEPATFIGDEAFVPSFAEGGYTIAPSGPAVGDMVYDQGSQDLIDIATQEESFSAIRDRTAEDQRQAEESARKEREKQEKVAADARKAAESARRAQQEHEARANRIREEALARDEQIQADDRKAIARANADAERARNKEREEAEKARQAVEAARLYALAESSRQQQEAEKKRMDALIAKQMEDMMRNMRRAEEERKRQEELNAQRLLTRFNAPTVISRGSYSGMPAGYGGPR